MKIKLKPMPDQDMETRRVLIALADGITPQSAEIDGYTRTWQEFVPSCYDGTSALPLVVTLHGGGGWDTNQKFAWPLVGERDGFFVLYPQSLDEKSSWNFFNRRPDGPDEVRYIDALIDRFCEKYKVDTTRIYLHGQSLGDITSTWYLLHRSDRFAAACPASGPCSADYLIGEDGALLRTPPAALPVVRTHGSLDNGLFGVPAEQAEGLEGDELYRAKMELNQLPGMELWLRTNGCSRAPKLSLRGIYNAVHFEGGEDFWYYSVENGEHNPSPDYADNLWSYFLSAYSRVDGKVVKGAPKRVFEEDRGAIALSDGSALAYVDNRPVKMSGPALMRSGTLFPKGYMYVPADFAAEALGAKISYTHGGLSAEFELGGHKLQCAAGVRACVLDEGIRCMPLCLNVDRRLYVPLGEVAAYLCGMNCYDRAGATYITHSEGVLTYDMAYIINRILGQGGQL